MLSGSMFCGHQPGQLCSRVQWEDVWPDVHPEGDGACESSCWLANKTSKWNPDMLLFVRRILTPLFWPREIQRGPTWRSVTRWEGSPITSTSSTTWWELHDSRDVGSDQDYPGQEWDLLCFMLFFAERVCKENRRESTSAMWQNRLRIKDRF